MQTSAVVFILTMYMSFIGQAHAQFLGDTFFETPSFSASSGETVTLDVAVFTGTSALGSVDFEVSFESSFFEVTDISFPNDLAGVTKLLSEDGTTRLRVVVANGTSNDTPNGIASFLNITGTILAAPGTTITFSPENHNVFQADLTEITNSSLSGEIIVLSQSISQASKISSQTQQFNQVVKANVGSALYERASSLSPNGENVTIARTDGTYLDVILISEEKLKVE